MIYSVPMGNQIEFELCHPLTGETKKEKIFTGQLPEKSGFKPTPWDHVLHFFINNGSGFVQIPEIVDKRRTLPQKVRIQEGKYLSCPKLNSNGTCRGSNVLCRPEHLFKKRT